MTAALILPTAAPTSSHPVTASGGPGLLRRIVDRLRALQEFRQLSDRHLRDIGLTRGDVEALHGLPLGRDVSTHLALRSGSRAGNW